MSPEEQRLSIEGQARELPRCGEQKLASLHVEEGSLLKLEHDAPRGILEEFQRRASAVVTELAEDILGAGKLTNCPMEVISLNVYIPGHESFWVREVSHLGDLKQQI